ncbi:THAP domain-containing protein 5-like isoform X1 [Mycetomoellerius zeteki]|uniref:THAP domain-containing protein 5-like isoform X1 n=2 Tax=Mycetomoellerius zeteki TaxID=64791 RepID=UPI00084E8652|nr:PREDICTED: THAP domain-containing protein 5-like isoform X1 [Trachymyrmex zeteki]
MPNSCCAGYCTNINIKGYQMCRFPKDLERKRIWIQNMNRTDWIPTSDARLCDVHFAPHMWMTRKDGSRRLKSDAVPTIFGENLPTSITRQNTMTEAAETDMFENAANEMEEEMEINEEDITEEEKNDVLGILSNRTETSDPCVLQRLEKLEMLWKKSERLRLQMKKKLQQAKRRIKRLQTEIVRSSDIHPAIKGIEFHPYT